MLGARSIVKQRENVTLNISGKQVVEKLDRLRLFGRTAALERDGGASNILGTINQRKQSQNSFSFPVHILKQNLMEQRPVFDYAITLISKKRKESYKSSIVAA